MGLMNRVFHDYLDKFVLVFIDDILIHLDILENQKSALAAFETNSRKAKERKTLCNV